MSFKALRLVLICIAASAMAACGLKGPLYLPDKAGEVVTRPASKPSEAPPETAPQPSTTPPADESTATKDNKPK